MLYRFPVKEIKSGSIKRGRNHLVIVMQHYPRFISKTLIDEYLHSLAPERDLFAEFKVKDRELKNHDLAFDEVQYEKRFSLTSPGKEDLERLCETAQSKEVLLFCQCHLNEKCHADLLLLLAQHWFEARISPLRMTYPVFLKRLQNSPEDFLR